jgi:hypothetical protein
MHMVTALMMETVHTSEMSVNIYRNTWCNIPEGSYLHIRCHENLISHNMSTCCHFCCYLNFIPSPNLISSGNYDQYLYELHKIMPSRQNNTTRIVLEICKVNNLTLRNAIDSSSNDVLTLTCN